jgi:sigma-B regulation protein RsbU (phosphoserine phosphatase)
VRDDELYFAYAKSGVEALRKLLDDGEVDVVLTDINMPEFEIHAAMIPAQSVGGDFYDFFLIDDDRLGFVIGDVSGKGVPAALFMAVSKTLLKATALKGLPPAECLQQINRILYLESVAAMFVTIFYGILDARTGEVEYCNGGHNPPRLLRAGGQIEASAPTGGIALGAMKNSAYKAQKIILQAGDGFFLFTDGVTEAMDRDGELFSEGRLEENLKGKPGVHLPGLAQSVIDAVNAHAAGAPQADDITILALRFLARKA